LLLKQPKNKVKKFKNLPNKIIKIPPKNSKNQIKLMQICSDFSESMKNKIKNEKWV